jgi:hypothetical protein
MGKRKTPEEVEDHEGVWRRLVSRFAYHWEWSVEDVNRYFLDRAVAALVRAIFSSEGRKTREDKIARDNMICTCARCFQPIVSTGGCTVCRTVVSCSLCGDEWCGVHYPSALEEHHKAVHEDKKDDDVSTG